MAVPSDPREWTADDVQEFALRAAADQLEPVTLALAANGDPRSFEVLRRLLSARGESLYEKHLLAILPARAFLQAGPPGVRVLSDVLTRGPRPRYAPSILMMLWQAGRGEFSHDDLLRGFGPTLTPLDPPADTSEAARQALSEYIAEALVNPRFFADIGGWLSQLSLLPGEDPLRAEAAADVASLLGEASIRLSRSVLDNYADLIASVPREEAVQQVPDRESRAARSLGRHCAAQAPTRNRVRDRFCAAASRRPMAARGD